MASVTAEPQSGRREERWFVARLFLWLLLAIALFWGLLQFRAQFNTSGLHRAKLPDGTWIVVRGTSTGRVHSVEVPYPISYQLRRMKRKHSERYTTPEDRMVLWVTRENDRGQPLDLSWFLRAEMDVSDSETLSPHQYQRQTVSSFNSNSSGSTRSGFNDAKPFGSALKVDLAMIRMEFPLVRPRDGQMVLHLLDGAKRDVGTVQIPYPRLSTISTEEWQPDPLPASRTDGNLTVTLDAVKFVENVEQGGVSVVPQLTFVHDGQPSMTWTTTQYLHDLLGNECQTWNSDLSPSEPAWKLKLTMYQMANGRFTPEESARLPLRPLTPVRKLVQANETHSVNGEKVMLIGLGGPGPLEFQLPNSSAQFTTTAYRPGQLGFGVSNSCVNSKCKVEFSSGYPFLITSDSSGQRGASVQVLLRDQDGEVMAQRGLSTVEGYQFWFFEPKPTSTSVEVEIIVQKHRHAEFLISPPKPDEIQRRQ